MSVVKTVQFVSDYFVHVGL